MTAASGAVTGYHAHIYCDEEGRSTAARYAMKAEVFSIGPHRGR